MMQEFQDKVAVVTGAASGIGRAIAERCGQEGMKVVLADVEKPALAQAAAEMKAAGADVLAVLTDVSKSNDVEALAERTLDAFGAVHLLCNNAGVVTPSVPIWENTLNDWKWVIGVNLWGVIHGVRVFVPIMLEQGTECHIVNTASAAGLQSMPGFGTYAATKHAVVSLSETLQIQLAEIDANINVSVLCPGMVRTRIADSQRNRPKSLRNAGVEEAAMSEEICQALDAGMSPERVAGSVFDAIREESFYILTHPETKQEVRMRMDGILQERNPGNL
jgi:NAD(P)-dependent dehydrogenase (short-subunit alcohol dehydrogenase family)